VGHVPVTVPLPLSIHYTTWQLKGSVVYEVNRSTAMSARYTYVVNVMCLQPS